MEQVLYEVKKTIVGQDVLLERLLVALLVARPHPRRGRARPGQDAGRQVARRARSAGSSTGSSSPPTWCRPTSSAPAIYHQRSGEFQVSLGPVFTNLLLADEINRAPAKVQSALLEVMQEQQVTIGRETHRVPRPFLVMATQNPIESEGTYPLPEAQVDRFMMKVARRLPQPDRGVRHRRAGHLARRRSARRSSTPSGSSQMQAQVEQVYVDPALIEYSVRLANATRRPAEVGLGDLARYITFGASPRASINLVLAARALAFIRGRDYVLPHDVTDLALDVLRHRLVLSYEALSDDVTADAVLDRVLAALPVPDVAAAHGPLTGDQRTRPPAAAPGVAGRPPARRPAAGRLPHRVPRHRHRLRRPARVHARRTTSGTSTGT